MTLLKKQCYFIYQENPTDYVVMDLTDGIDVYRGKKEVTTKLKVSYWRNKLISF